MSVKKYTKAEVRKINREKKKRYYERHGIKFDKTIRNRNAAPSRSGVEFTSQTLLYENYKEPLKPIKNGKGFGYYGTLALTSDKKYVQCHICGHLFPSVAAHLRKHKMSAEEYKEMFQLGATTALISEPTRRKLQEAVVPKLQTSITGELPPWLQEYNRKVQTGEVKHIGSKRREGGLPLERRNELGICPDQVLEKIRELGEELGHTPSVEEFRRKYKGRYTGSIRFQHGSYLKAVKKLGLKSAKELKEPTNEDLLQDLVDFRDTHNRIPMTSDFKRGLLRPRAMYFRRFGSLNNARIEAGLNAILPLPFGKIIEMSADEYLTYKQRHQKAVAA